MSQGYSISESAARQATDSFTQNAEGIKRGMQATYDSCSNALRRCQGGQFIAFFGLLEKIQVDMTAISRELDVQGQLVAQASSGYMTADGTVTQDYHSVAKGLPGLNNSRA